MASAAVHTSITQMLDWFTDTESGDSSVSISSVERALPSVEIKIPLADTVKGMFSHAIGALQMKLLTR